MESGAFENRLPCYVSLTGVACVSTVAVRKVAMRRSNGGRVFYPKRPASCRSPTRPSDRQSPVASRLAAGIRDVRLHDLRHRFALVGVIDDLSLPVIAALLGREHSATTSRAKSIVDGANLPGQRFSGGGDGSSSAGTDSNVQER
jgi:hypothetical protein